MGRSKGRSKKEGGVAVPVYDSDDERAYSKEDVPDPTDDSYFQDEVDDFHANREKLLLDQGASLEPAGFSSDEQEEVLGLGSGEDDSEDEEIQEYRKRLNQVKGQVHIDKMGSDLEEEEEDDGLPDEKAWGKKRSKFYGADVDDDEDIDFSGSEPDAALLEEQEALAIQKKMAEQLEDQDFGLDIFKTVKKSAEPEEAEKIKKDLSKLSKREKLQLLKKDSPELLDLIEDYKTKMSELKDTLLPMAELLKKGVLPSSKGAEYVETKAALYFNYCVNISFYMMLKAKQTPVHNHPVIGRLLQYRNLIKQLDPVDVRLKPQLEKILEKVSKGEEIQLAKPAKAESSYSVMKSRKMKQKAEKEGIRNKKRLSEMMEDSSDDESGPEGEDLPQGGRSWGRKKAKTKDGRYETSGEQQALEYYEMMKAGRGTTDLQEEEPEMDDESGMRDAQRDESGNPEEEEEAEGDEKRAITYEMAKNKGLTPHRKKEYRNPRVKHRMKYRKAKIRRKGQVREARFEMSRYGGEISGIRAGIKKSIKLK